MADTVQIPESGGGEGAGPVAAAITAPVQPATEAKLEASVEPTVAETQKEVKPEEQKEVKSQETHSAPKAEQTETPKEVIPVGPTEIKSEQTLAVQPELTAVNQEAVQHPEQGQQISTEVKTETNGVAENVATPNVQDDWQQRESALLKKIEELEKVKKERTQESLHLELKVREEEIDLLKARVKNLETELQAAMSKPSGKNHEMIENIKQQHEELLSKARGMIFDKTKMVKNQELQIEALTTQIQSLKDINQITKDLLEIRNSEIKAMEDRLQAMEARFKAEKERYGLVLQRAQTSSNINDDLRKEYETQLALFKELREKYDQRVQALVAENERLKGSVNQANANGGAGTSG